MKNRISAADVVEVIATKALTSGQALLVGSLFGFAVRTCAQDELIDIARVGQFSYKRATGTAWTAGQKVYYDATNDVLTHSNSGTSLIGVTPFAAAAGDAEGIVVLNGTAV